MMIRCLRESQVLQPGRQLVTFFKKKKKKITNPFFQKTKPACSTYINHLLAGLVQVVGFLTMLLPFLTVVFVYNEILSYAKYI